MTIDDWPKCLIAMDSFKGSLSAREAGQAIAEGLLKALPQASIDLCPLGDGGEGTLAVLLDQWPGGSLRYAKVCGPLPHQKVEAAFGWWPAKKLAVVEAAKACGLPLMDPSTLRPLAATTFGVGELIGEAQALGAAEIYLTVGGSATMDGGLGAARALGWQALDADSHPLEHGGGSLTSLAKLIPPATQNLCPISVWHDVTNPLTGPRGAATVFGPQKGASPTQIDKVERGFHQLASLWSAFGDEDFETLPGGGAAGGLAVGMRAFFGAALVPGAAGVAAAVDLEKRTARCDWVITGEGRFDDTSLQGKVVSHVALLAKRLNKPLVLIAGSLGAAPDRIGATHAWSLVNESTSLEICMEQPERHLVEAGRSVGQWIGRQIGHRP